MHSRILAVVLLAPLCAAPWAGCAYLVPGSPQAGGLPGAGHGGSAQAISRRAAALDQTPELPPAREKSVTVTLEAERIEPGAADSSDPETRFAQSEPAPGRNNALRTQIEAELHEVDPALQSLVARQVAAALAHERVAQSPPAAAARNELRPSANVTSAVAEEEEAPAGNAHESRSNALRQPVAPSASAAAQSQVSPEPKTAITATAPSPERPAAANPPAEKNSIALASATQPISAAAPAAPLAPERWQDSLQQTLQALVAARNALPADSPDRLRFEAVERLLQLAEGNNEAALRAIEAKEPWQRDYYRHQLHALSVFLNEQGSPVASRRAALTLRHLHEALAHLSSGSSLDVRNLAFCTQVDGFGRFTEFPQAEFKPNQEVLLYAEIDNVTSIPAGNEFESSLAGSYQITDASGRRAAEHSFPVEVDSCRNRRRDFFIPFRLYMPKQIARGSYTLQLTVEDLKGRKFGQATIDFRVVD